MIYKEGHSSSYGDCWIEGENGVLNACGLLRLYNHHIIKK